VHDKMHDMITIRSGIHQDRNQGKKSQQGGPNRASPSDSLSLVCVQDAFDMEVQVQVQWAPKSCTASPILTQILSIRSAIHTAALTFIASSTTSTSPAATRVPTCRGGEEDNIRPTHFRKGCYWMQSQDPQLSTYNNHMT
jgi:hypothetical protein